MFSKNKKSTKNPLTTLTIDDFNLQVLKNCPLLEPDEIRFFIPRLVYELAKYINPIKIAEIGHVLIDGFSSFQIKNENLVILYEELHGETNFQKLAEIFNHYNPAFDAHYTDTKVTAGNRSYFALNYFSATSDSYYDKEKIKSSSYYVLCLNANVFLSIAFNRMGIQSHSIQINNQFDLYRKSERNLIIEKKPYNHYPVHKLDIEITDRLHSYKIHKKKNVEVAIEEWIKARHSELITDKLFYFTLYLLNMFQTFPIDIIKAIFTIINYQSNFESDERLNDIFFNELMKSGAFFFNPYKETKESEKKAVELIESVFENTLKSNQKEKNIVCVFTEDSTIIRFTDQNQKTYGCVLDIFTKLFKDKNSFTIEKFKNQQKSSHFSEVINIYITFPVCKYKFFKEACKEMINVRENKKIV